MILKENELVNFEIKCERCNWFLSDIYHADKIWEEIIWRKCTNCGLFTNKVSVITYNKKWQPEYERKVEI